jgi:hypothetical protein
MDRLNTELKSKAIALGLCSQWTAEWSEKDKHELCEMYKRGIDFCIKNSYPKNEYMKYHFDGIMQQHGIYVDDNISIRGRGILVLNGKTQADVLSNDYDVCTLYVRHATRATVNVRGRAKVFIHLYDDAKLSVTQDGRSNVYVYQHGGDLITSGDVKVRRKS